MQLRGETAGGDLKFLLLKIIKNVLVLEKKALIVFIFLLIFSSKFSFKSI